jgi:glutamine synthetase adenylyltransferase
MYRPENDTTQYLTDTLLEGTESLYDYHYQDYHYFLEELDHHLKEASKKVKEIYEKKECDSPAYSLSDNINQKKQEIIRIAKIADQMLKTFNTKNINEIPAKLEDYIKDIESNTNYFDFEAFNKKRHTLEVLSDILMIR